MDARVEVRVRHRPAAAAVCGAFLVVMSAGCSGSSASAAPPPRATSAPAATAGASTAPAAATAPPAAAGPVGTHIKVYANCTSPTVRPPEIVLACADYGALLEGLRWTSWTAASATAVGTFEYNDCTPSCAEGRHRDIPGTTVTLTVPVEGAGGQVVWSRIQESPEPPGYATGPYHGGPQPLPIGPV
jgi:hypothetical protein